MPGPKPKRKTKKSPDPLAVTFTEEEATFPADSIGDLDLTEGRLSKYDQISQMRKQISATHKLYKSKRADAARAELYLSLFKFFKNGALEQARVFFDSSWPDGLKLYEQLCQPDKALHGYKVLNKQKKIQDLTKMIMDRNATQFGFIPSMCARLDLGYMIARKNLIEWQAYCLQEEEGKTNEFFQTATRREISARALEYIEQKLAELVLKLNSEKYFYAHTKGDDDFGFFCVREQEANSNRSCIVYFAFTPGKNNLFVSLPRHTILDPNVFKIVVESLGFSKAEDQKLRGVDLTRVYESCIRRVDVGFPTLARVNKEFDDEVKEMRKRHVYHLFPEEAKKMKLQCAMIDDKQPSGVDRVNIKHKFMTDGNEEFPPVMSSLSVSIKIKGNGTMDECMADLYRRGVIKDVTPYLAMKASQSNSVTVHYKK